MASKFGGINTGMNWVQKKFEEHDRELRELRAAKNAQATTIGDGGLTVASGGSLQSTYPNGAPAARFGPYPTDTETGYGFFLNTEDGTPLFGAVRYPIAEQSAFALQNMNSVVTVSDSTTIYRTGFDAWVDLGVLGLELSGGTAGVKIVHDTTASAANCYISPIDNRIYRSTSSRRYKTNIEDAEIDPADVLKMQGRTFRDKGEVEKDPDTQTRYVGFIAEELHDLGLGQFVVYDDDGPEAIAYDRLSVALLAVLKAQQATITDLAERIEALESAHEAPAEP